MRHKNPQEARRLFAALEQFEVEFQVVPGIRSQASRETFVDRIVESQRKAEVFRRMAVGEIGARRADPASGVFDPYKAAVLANQRGDIEEALWLVFLAVHFGKHRESKWQYVVDFYGRLGEGGRWSWGDASRDVEGVRDWLAENGPQFKRADQRSGFGNHRKYESLGGWTSAGTGAVVESYVGWIQESGSHETMLEIAFDRHPGDPTAQFDEIYRSMRKNVHRFGRTACFDYLATIGKLDLAPIEPGKAYLAGATGPLRGARIMFGSSRAGSRELESRLACLESHLHIGFDALEDALCNWQKDPSRFKRFRG